MSKAKAQKLIYCTARCGNHYAQVKLNSDLDVKNYLYHYEGIDFEALVNHARTVGAPIPFENLVGSVWTTTGVNIQKVVNGIPKTVLHDDGQYTGDLYWSYFEQSLKSLNSAIENISMGDLQTCIERGVASVNAYISHRAAIWNQKNPTAPLLDSPRINFDIRINQWIPTMSGKKIDKSGINWQNFMSLKRYRDRIIVHPEVSVYGISNKEFQSMANKFMSGIAGLLFDLHCLFNEKVPFVIIKEMCGPEIILEKLDNPDL